MARIVVLDSTPLNLLTMRPGSTALADRCQAWVSTLGRSGSRIVVPGIADYEVRRELVRKGASARIAALDTLRRTLPFLPVGQAALDLATTFWAVARNTGRPTAPPEALDGDAILAAQATLAAGPGDTVVVATGNVSHLSLFIQAMEWDQIA